MGNINYFITFAESKQNRGKCPQVYNPNTNEDKNDTFSGCHTLIKLQFSSAQAER